MTLKKNTRTINKYKTTKKYLSDILLLTSISMITFCKTQYSHTVSMPKMKWVTSGNVAILCTPAHGTTTPLPFAGVAAHSSSIQLFIIVVFWTKLLTLSSDLLHRLSYKNRTIKKNKSNKNIYKIYFYGRIYSSSLYKCEYDKTEAKF